jgi:hypothetical protein
LTANGDIAFGVGLDAIEVVDYGADAQIICGLRFVA